MLDTKDLFFKGYKRFIASSNLNFKWHSAQGQKVQKHPETCIQWIAKEKKTDLGCREIEILEP